MEILSLQLLILYHLVSLLLTVYCPILELQIHFVLIDDPVIKLVDNGEDNWIILGPNKCTFLVFILCCTKDLTTSLIYFDVK